MLRKTSLLIVRLTLCSELISLNVMKELHLGGLLMIKQRMNAPIRLCI